MNAANAAAKTEAEEFPPIGEMHRDAVDVRPVEQDWSKGYGEDFEYWEAGACDECGEVVVGSGGAECRKGHEVTLEGPMMSYWYPLECIADPEEAARAIAHLPLCVVQVDGMYGLALTGGGMNLAWEICEAFLLLGHVPPLQYADLPGISGRGKSARDRWIVEGCLDSANTAGARAGRVEQTLRRILKEGA